MSVTECFFLRVDPVARGLGIERTAQRVITTEGCRTIKANVLDTVAQRYVDVPHHLMAADWRSGDQVWIIALVTPFGGAAEVMKELRETVFAGREIRQLMPDAHGQGKTLTWPAVRVVH